LVKRFPIKIKYFPISVIIDNQSEVHNREIYTLSCERYPKIE
jgi:hypothetical protein